MQVAFRVDASPQIGTGHFMRCLTLADALRTRGAHTRFLCRHLPAHLRTILPSRGHELIMLDGDGDTSGDLRHSAWLGTSQDSDLRDCIAAMAGAHVDWCVVDHYAIDWRWESGAKTFCSRILVIDDLADRRHECDILLDQNPGAAGESRYRSLVPSGCRTLLGSRYALLREAFAIKRKTVQPRDGRIRRILVFFGGIDLQNHTSLAIAALARIGTDCPRVDVVIGAAHPARDQIQEECRTNGFVCHVQTDMMPELMAAADLSIGAGGTAVLERCCMGLPALSIPTAENQVQQVRDAAAGLLLYSPEIHGPIADGISCHLRALMENPPLLRAISLAGMEAVDGLGAARVADTLLSADIELRPAGPDDSGAILTWRNHPDVCAASINQAPISQADHEAWFRRRLASPDAPILIGHRAGEPVGVVRFDICDSSAEVSIYRVPGSQGNGLAGEILMRAERWLADVHPEVRELIARVRAENGRSQKLFLRAGYLPHSSVFIKVLQTDA